MTQQNFRLSSGGLINRSQPLSFTFDGNTCQGYQGDTLAAALLANGVRLVGRSFKYHRPRGIFSAGSEEPNALMELRTGNRLEPNTRATVIELFDGLVAASQNRWPSLAFDISELNNLVSRFLPAGFYYKTFMWPASFWEKYEYIIRRAAGLGTASREPDPDRYDWQSAHCEVLVIGAGPAGLAAAKAAAEQGARVILLDENPRCGGWLLKEQEQIDGQPALSWVAETVAALQALENVKILTRTTAFGYYDHNFIAAVERVQDHVAVPAPFIPRQRLWKLRARQVVLATGAIEQPIAFADNDRPGVMLAGAVRAYINNFAVLPGRRVVIMTNNDSAYRTALDLHAAGAEVPAVIDLRETPTGDIIEAVRECGISVLSGHGIAAVNGRLAVKSVDVMPLVGGSGNQRLFCDVVCSSAGWAPALHLHSQAGGQLAYQADLGAFVPGMVKQAGISIGAAAGHFELTTCLSDGARYGREAVSDSISVPAVNKQLGASPQREIPGKGHHKRFIDLQNDVTTSDVELAAREGYLSVEHLKRYTTLGMATDQGKTSNLGGLNQMAELRGKPVPEVGATTFRPPYTPVSLGALGGRDIGSHFEPLRRTPMDEWHGNNGVEWIDAGLWRRSHYYPQAGETVDDASCRETIATRSGVGICDVSPLGKIDIQGPDAAVFLNRIYVNGWKSLPVGKCRYGLMLREDGLVYDDGTTARLGENHYHMTTTTANAVKVMANLEYYLQALWSELRVQVTSVTEQWAGMSVAGPKSRQVLEKIIDIDIANDVFPFMAVSNCKVNGIPGRLFRISFSGELAYEINVPADFGQAAWDSVLEAGKEHDVVVYGTETLGTMRVEKGHVAGAELDGRTTLDDLGLGRMASSKKDFIGKPMLQREAFLANDRKKLVGLQPVDGKTWIKAGSQLVVNANAKPPVKMLGHVSSIAYSPELGMPIALALLEGGLEREGETLYAAFPLRHEAVPVKVVPAHFVDPKGERMYV